MKIPARPKLKRDGGSFSPRRRLASKVATQMMYVTMRATLQTDRMMLNAMVLPMMIMLKMTVEPRVTKTAVGWT